jgi:16S rRNA (guanine527-N7)-methyltransferase
MPRARGDGPEAPSDADPGSAPDPPMNTGPVSNVEPVLGAQAGPASGAVGEPPPTFAAAAHRLFGARLPLAIRYAKMLATDGVERGLIGPNEGPRLWERHLLNCAVVAEIIQPDARVVDVGSGAGLPGIVLAVARPDLSVILVEPLARRTAFLSEVVATLGLDRTTVVRARAEECVPKRGSPRFGLAAVVTARAVAPLDRLTAWCLPLAAEGGRVLALKGESGAEEVERHRGTIARLGGTEPTVLRCGVDVIDPPTIVVQVVRAAKPPAPVSAASRRRGRRRSQ